MTLLTRLWQAGNTLTPTRHPLKLSPMRPSPPSSTLCKFTSFNASYEASFASPLFAIATSNMALISSLFNAISPRFPIRTTDIQVHGGHLVSDVRVRVSLFNGNAILETTADKFSAQFTGAQGQQDVEIIKDCVSLALDGLRSWNTELKVRQEILKATFFGDLLQDNITSTDVINACINANERFTPESYGAASIHPALRIELENPEESWRVSLDLVRSWVAPKGFLLIADATFQDGTIYSTLQEKVDFINKRIARFLADAGLTSSSDQPA